MLSKVEREREGGENTDINFCRESNSGLELDNSVPQALSYYSQMQAGLHISLKQIFNGSANHQNVRLFSAQIPSREVDKSEEKFWVDWNHDTKQFFLQFHFRQDMRMAPPPNLSGGKPPRPSHP